MRNTLYAMILTALAAACSKSEIETWNAKPYVWFTNASDTILFSFYSQPEGTEEYIVEIPLSMAGEVDSVDRQVNVKDLGSQNAGTRYEVVSAVIPGGETSGTLSVRVYKTDNLAVENDTIGFEIVESDVFLPGLEDYLKTGLVVSSRLSQPAWWTTMVEMYLGYYSDEKLAIIYECDYYELFESTSSWSGDDVSVAIYRLNQYCEENNCTYSDGSEIRFYMYSN